MYWESNEEDSGQREGGGISILGLHLLLRQVTTLLISQIQKHPLDSSAHNSSVKGIMPSLITDKGSMCRLRTCIMEGGVGDYIKGESIRPEEKRDYVTHELIFFLPASTVGLAVLIELDFDTRFGRTHPSIWYLFLINIPAIWQIRGRNQKANIGRFPWRGWLLQVNTYVCYLFYIVQQDT